MVAVPNLLNMASNEFRSDVVNRISGAIGESSSTTQAALNGVNSAILGGLVSKASTSQGAKDLLDLLQRNRFDTAEFSDAARAVSSTEGIPRLIETGGSLLISIFGSRLDAVIDWLTSFAGIKKTSASSLLSLAVPVVLGIVGKQASASGWSASSLMSLLSGQLAYLETAPAGLSSILGFKTPTSPRVATYETGETQRAVDGDWWKWLLPLLALATILGYFLFRDRQSEVPAVAVVTPTIGASATPAVIESPGAFIERRLPTGVTLSFPSNGVESKLLAFIEDPARMIDRETWFSFDRLEFATDSPALLPGSAEQLRNIAEILKAYPNVSVKIGGYTDNIGDPTRNMKLSTDRATNTMNEIAKLGIAPSRLAAEGYGEQHPVADNSTEEGRQRNRRIAIRVTKK